MSRRSPSKLLAVLAASGVALATAIAAPAAAAPDTQQEFSADMVEAVARDLNMSEAQAEARLAAEAKQNYKNLVLEKELGADYAGGWLNSKGDKLTVAVTDSAAAAEVKSAGASAKVVDFSADALDAERAKLDKAKAKAPKSVPSWYVDVKTNRVVVLAAPGSEKAAKKFVKAAGADAKTVSIVTSNEQPRTYIDVVGGNAYYIGSGSRCSIGFSVQGGFVTAGHCGSTGSSTSQPTGTFRGSSFPGNDYGWVQVASGNTMIGAVNNYSGGRVSVNGSQDAAVGATVCRSGSTTGWHCGSITARNASVTYPQGTVNGLIRTTVCAEPGDSGGSLLAGNQAQGMTSGGSGNCSSGGTTYFQPVNEALQVYGLTLLTGGGGGEPPGGDCSNANYSGNLSGSGDVEYEPNGNYYYSSRSGTHSGCLDGPSGTDFDLHLLKWNGSRWATVAQGITPNPDETVSYNGTAGYYVWAVESYSGSGSYQLAISRP